MARRHDPLPKLVGDQARAAGPRVHAALSASAGTGKTQVLTARVLRLLLAGADPSSILCLTFTKAGAAEMAERIHGRLARWVRAKDEHLSADLAALGEPVGPAIRERARTLFADVLDATGGGLRIQTIHAFAQGLLGAFPAEAGLTPGFQPLEGRAEQQLVRATLAEMLVRAEQEGDHGLVRDVQALSLRMGEGGAEGFLRACARAPDALAALGSREGVEARLRLLFDLPLGDIEDAIAAECADDAFDLVTLRAIADANRAWGAATGLAACDAIAAWLARTGPDRGRTIDELARVVLTGKSEPRKASAGLLRAAPDYEEVAARLGDCCRRLVRIRVLGQMVAALAAGLRAGQVFALAYRDAKRAEGVADFDDLIRWAERLLAEEGMGEWVRYKLDQRTDHILVDEAQDTNARQWRIVEALTEEYFSGAGARGRHRTIFTVGDFKQAIFGFQGTDPQEFERARASFRQLALAARDSALDADTPADVLPPDFHDLSMEKSFRSSPEILAVADRVIGDLGYEAFGLPERPLPHAAHHSGRVGSVTLWKPFVAEADAGEEGWIAETTRAYAGALAKQIRGWLDAPFRIEKTGKPLRPEDILILVRRRGELAGLLVARLHREGVPVAGVDRLRLSAPLAVQDLLAAARFAVQPLDDLNLASLLVSPLFGWSQDQLHAVAADRKGALWPVVRNAAPADTRDGLAGLLAMADLETPYGFFEATLSGPLDGRRRLLDRLGGEARDPIEELLSAALDFAGPQTSLQDFLDWFARGEVEIVRDPSAPRDAVRVMTAHGAKGLQAPVVILADACADPARLGPGQRLAALPLPDIEEKLPVFRPRAEAMAEPLASIVARQDMRDMQEHWRLLYVAMTRAEERLYVGGALGAMAKGVAPVASWHRAIETALAGMGTSAAETDIWGSELRLGEKPRSAAVPPRATARAISLPPWIAVAAPAEARPPRPLTPSAPGEDEAAYPPPDTAARAAARRGELLHRLFERLPAVPPEQRRDRADVWLLRSAGVADEAERSALVADACRIVDHPDFAPLFGPDALAEAPIAAVVPGGAVVSGTVDRLLVEEGRILVADFKTGRRVPGAAADAPASHLRQMAAYRDALRVIFPDRPVETALLYTAAPVLLPLPDALLDAYRPTA
ncbi:double-strand break repair helicase AddA [Sphingosinicella sp.]|uniref:double-strand break repair helicase AddA n=1 Tax=Sphingosinicella sp. TaxID=1917971 RepID=UPI004037BA60